MPDIRNVEIQSMSSVPVGLEWQDTNGFEKRITPSINLRLNEYHIDNPSLTTSTSGEEQRIFISDGVFMELIQEIVSDCSKSHQAYWKLLLPLSKYDQEQKWLTDDSSIQFSSVIFHDPSWDNQSDTHQKNANTCLDRKPEVLDQTTPQETKWLNYLDTMEEKGHPIPSNIVASARQLWLMVGKRADQRLKVPQAGPTNEGGMFLSWDSDKYHVEIEILPDCTYEWFYKDRQSNLYGGDIECASFKDIVDELVFHLQKLA